MAKRESVNVWFDRPGNFLEIFWGIDDCGCAEHFDKTEFDPAVFIDSNNNLAGFHIIGALTEHRDLISETYTVDACPSHPLTVKYDRAADLWDVHWGPDTVNCMDTPNPRIKAKTDNQGQIQGVLISDLRNFENEILNENLYPVQPATPTT